MLLGGEASIAYENSELAVADLEKGERFGIPVALIILLIIFGTLVAALLPVGLAIVSIVVALGVTALIGQAFKLSFFVTLMITMIGLAIGIDYSLLLDGGALAGGNSTAGETAPDEGRTKPRTTDCSRPPLAL